MYIRTLTAVAALLALSGTPAWVQPIPSSDLAPSRERFLAWRDAEQVYGYRHIERIFSTNLIARGDTVRALPVAARTLVPRYIYGDEVGDVDDYLTRNRVAGLLVIQGGQIVLERYGLGQGGADRWTSFSVGKSITSTLIGAAIRDGHIRSVEDPISAYIPELGGSAYGTVTIADVLKMRSGVRWNEDYVDPASDVGRLVSSMAHDRGDSLVDLMAALPRETPVGTRFRYSTGESNLLGVLVTRATGRPLATYLSEKIWRPYGMERDAVWITDGGVEVGGCCISMTLRDYGRFALFILGGGRIDGAQALADEWVEQSTTDYNSGPPADDAAYGYQWWPQADGAYAAVGIFGQSIFIDPRRDLVVVTSSAWPEASWQEGYARQAAFLDALRNEVDTGPAT